MLLDNIIGIRGDCMNFWLRPDDNGNLVATLSKDNKEIELNEEELKKIWEQLNTARSFNFKLPF